MEHLLVHCQKARLLRELFLNIVGVSWVFRYSVHQILFLCQGAQVGKKCKFFWEAAPLCIFWMIWQGGTWWLLIIKDFLFTG